ncbi:dehydration-responsive element-binding protein 1F-like [Triticum aestivum]|uniref:dehydration-responsive element-binding protein 1F-like n=1 Tax=Triticum aestivum TaxID=4565 RepID=UPI001D0047CF|nr:dehydration-responsive element-binding protein 1F-like [Triticum aestivum]
MQIYITRCNWSHRRSKPPPPIPPRLGCRLSPRRPDPIRLLSVRLRTLSTSSSAASALSRPRPPPRRPDPVRLLSGRLRTPFASSPAASAPRSPPLRPPSPPVRPPPGPASSASSSAASCSSAARSPMAPKGKSGFFGVRAKPSGNFGVEFFNIGRRWWLGTHPTADDAARAYDVAVWRAGRPKMDLNFLEIESQAMAEWLMPQGIRMEEMPAKKAKKRPAVVVAPGESDEAAMARFVREHPQYVQAELRDIVAKKKGVKEDEAGSSTVIPIELSDED